MPSFDPRIVRVSIEIDGQLKTIDNLAIYASGLKFDNAIQNECEVKITNLDRATLDYILTETSPLNTRRVPKRIIVEAGRKSWGTAQIIVGDIIAASISQPPDVVLTLKALTGNYYNGDVVSRYFGASAPVSQIADQIAGDLGLSLDFQAADKNVSNWSFTGGAGKQVAQLAQTSDMSCYVDDRTLVLKPKREPLQNTLRVLSVDSGMVGIPELSPYGVKVKYMLDNTSKLGGGLQIVSKQNPAANGVYCIYKLGFEIANRDTPFYYTAEAYRV